MSSTEGVANDQAAGETRLHRRALGVPDLVFFIVAASAPLTVVAGGASSTLLVTGNKGLPLLYLVLAAVLALFVAGYATMSHYITGAGAFYQYVSQGIGRVAGVGTSFVALVAYNAMQIGIYGLFGAAFGAFMADKAGINIEWYWWIFMAIAVIGTLGCLRVDLNAKVLALFLIGEVLVVLVFDLVVLGDPGPQGISISSYDPSLAFGAAVGATLTFVMAAFVGFESAAIYSEEVDNPKRTVARATYIALGITGLFYSFSVWMIMSAAGPDTAINPDALVKGGFTTPDGAAPDPTTILFVTLSDRMTATVADVATVLFCTSLFASSLSFHNAVARYFFALGRDRVLPGAFARTREANGAPFVGSLTQTALAAAVVAAFALSNADPVLELFTWLTNLGALGVFALIALASFAVVGYFWRDPRGHGLWPVRYAPAIAGTVMTAIFILAIGNFNVLITGLQDAPLDDRAVILPALLIVAGLIGMAVGAWLRKSKPEVYERIGRSGGGAE